MAFAFLLCLPPDQLGNGWQFFVLSIRTKANGKQFIVSVWGVCALPTGVKYFFKYDP